MSAGTSDGSKMEGRRGPGALTRAHWCTCCDLGGSVPTSVREGQLSQLTLQSSGCHDGQISRPGIQHTDRKPSAVDTLSFSYACITL